MIDTEITGYGALLNMKEAEHYTWIGRAEHLYVMDMVMKIITYEVENTGF